MIPYSLFEHKKKKQTKRFHMFLNIREQHQCVVSLCVWDECCLIYYSILLCVLTLFLFSSLLFSHFKYLFILEFFAFSRLSAIRIPCNVLKKLIWHKKHTDKIELRKKKQISEIVVQFVMAHPYKGKKWCQRMNFKIVNWICVRSLQDDFWLFFMPFGKIRLLCIRNLCELKMEFQWDFTKL